MRTYRVAPLLLLASGLAMAAESFTAPDTRGLDSVLDRLEKKLKDADRPLDERPAPLENYAKPHAEAPPVLKFREETINPAKEPGSELADLTAEINKLSSDTEQFATEIQTLKQNLAGASRKTNHIEVATVLEEPDNTALRTLRVSIDGYEVYRLSEAVGIWQAQKTHLLFAGPLQPGKHVIDFEARVAPRERQGLAVTQSVYTTITKSFDVAIVKGRQFESWTIKIAPNGEGGYDAAIASTGNVAAVGKGP